ncbi:MAG: transglycosylase domain-containing protein [Chitinophagales bacterium]|jgi:penicillin-binding protein 1A|nr:transglycosylase domain-containing protein [Chitinophagales bacterium]
MINELDQWRYFKVFLKYYSIGLLFLGFLFFLAKFSVFGTLPSLEDIKNPKNAISSVVLSEEMDVLGKYYIENRTELTYNEIPKHTVDALIATEDFRFRSHSGVDAFGLMSAFFRTFILAKPSGASTITQQLAKNLFHDTERKNIFKRIAQKIKEWIIAFELEENFSKDEIIALYFNTVSFLHNSYGLKEASMTYFGKIPAQLTIEESAVLVGMLKGPGLYNPKTRPENALKRRNIVLELMRTHDFIDQRALDSLKALPITLNYHLTSNNSGLAAHFRETLRLELIEILAKLTKPDGSSYNLYKDGLKIYTTINSELQAYAEEATKEHIQYLQKSFYQEWKGKDPYRYGAKANPNLVLNILKAMPIYKELENQGLDEKTIITRLSQKLKMEIYTPYGPKDTSISIIDSIKLFKTALQVGLLAVNPMNGHVKSWIGSADFNYFKYDHVKSARQVGSTIKPFLYALAIDNGMTPCSQVPYEAPNITGHSSWDPKGTPYFKEGQLVSLKNGLQVSDNRIAGQLIKKFSPNALIDYCRHFDITASFDPGPAIALGTSDISLFEMVRAYTSFVNRGIMVPLTTILRIEDQRGNIIYQPYFSPKEVLNPEVAFQMNLMMREVTQGRGTASRLRSTYKLNMPIIGKTGTTQSNSDGWFIGATPDLLCGVWVGCDDPSITFASTALGQGASSALPIWAKLYSKAYASKLLKYNPKKNFITNHTDSVLIRNFDCSQTIIDQIDANEEEIEAF